MPRLTFFIMLLAIAGFAHAQQPAEAMLVKTDAREILAQQAQIRDQARAGGGRFEGWQPEQFAELSREQDTVTRLLQGVNKTTDLASRDQMQVFNSLEAISALLNPSDSDDRMICHRTRPTGSNRYRTICNTVAQRRVEQAASQTSMERREMRCMPKLDGSLDCGQ